MWNSLRQRIITTVVVLGLLTGLSAIALAQSTLDTVKKRGELIVGVRQDQVPFSYENKSGQLVGFEVDLAKYIADKLGVSFKPVAVTASTRIPLLTQGRVDLLAATLSHYRSRDDVIDFSIGYYYSPLKVLVKKSSGLTTLAALKGHRVGTAVGSGSLTILPERVPGVDMQSFDNYQDAFVALRQGIVDGVATDGVVLAGIRARSASPQDYTFIDQPYGGSEFGMGVRENDSKWRDYVNYAIQDAWLDGTWKNLFNKWFGPGTDFAMTPQDLGGWQVKIWSDPLK